MPLRKRITKAEVREIRLALIEASKARGHLARCEKRICDRLGISPTAVTIARDKVLEAIWWSERETDGPIDVLTLLAALGVQVETSK